MKQQNGRNSINGHLGAIWTEIVERINLRQLEACMGDGLSDYRAKAEKVKTVSKSNEVHRLADELISVYDSHFGTFPLIVSNRDFTEFE